MPEDFKGTISYFNPSSHYSVLPIHARMVSQDDEKHYSMCHGNLGLPVLSFGENATPDKVTCKDCLRMLKSGFRYERHTNNEAELDLILKECGILSCTHISILWLNTYKKYDWRNYKMAKSDTGLEVNVGDTIEIEASNITVCGTVVTASHFFGAGWDIEIGNSNVSGGYSRWKEWQDGGKIIKVNNQEV